MVKNFLKANYILLALLIFSFISHLWILDHPNQVVFDEVHFGKFVGGYMTGNYFFDIHPPLGKLLIAGAGKLAGYKPGFGFENIGQAYPDSSYYSLRILPALVGSLIPLAVYLILTTLGLSKTISILGMLLAVFENSLLIQSRFILIDSFLIFFGLAGIFFYLRSRKQATQRKKVINLLVSGLFLGAAVSVKWTGLAFFFLVFILSASSLAKHCLKKPKSRVRPLIIFAVTLILIPLLLYMSVFAIHFSLLPHSGSGDAFMSPAFQSTLINNTSYNPSNNVDFLKKFVELNGVMLSANSGVTANHPYSISWYGMPAMYRAIYYWTKTENGLAARIYLMGNPFVWWPLLISIIVFIAILILKLIKRNFSYFKQREIAVFFLLAYLLNLATYIFIKRAVFLYHYFPSLILGIILFCLLSEKFLVKNNRPRKLYWLLVALAIFGFFFFSPLTYGTPLDDSAYKLLTWFPSWV